jgi:hypothetical protein
VEAPLAPTKKPVVIAISSDHHTGSTLGLCPPEGVRLDDDGAYKPSKAQAWTWNKWEAFWREVRATRDALKADLWNVYNGDLAEGDHHGTSQIISRNPEPAAYVSDRVFGVPLELGPARQFVVRGTEAHVGPSGATEEAWARRMKAEKNPETKTWSWWHLRFAVHGVRFDFQHHGRVGTRPWTKMNVVSALAAEIFYEHARCSIPHPHLAIRSHRHQFADTYDAHPTRVISTAAWQLKTAHAHKVAPESIADVGGHIVTVEPNGQYTVQHKLYRPELPPMWTPKEAA